MANINSKMCDFLCEVDKLYPKNRLFFMFVLNGGARLIGVNSTDYARQFSVSLSTVSRWQLGISAPHYRFRRHIYAYLVDRYLAK